jgi:threonine aldolase
MWSHDERRHFASDNNAGICPEVLEAIQFANSGHAAGYGGDVITEKAKKAFADLFETQCEVFFVFNGTAANSLAVGSFCSPHHSVICHQFSHLETDECNAPGFLNQGLKTVGIDGSNGKLAPDSIDEALKGRRDVHASQPRVISITNSTELGTLYHPEEVQNMGELAHRKGLALHVDGARFANAVAAAHCHPADLTWKAGVDVLVFGGTKNGLAVGEAVVFFDRERAATFLYRMKQAGQLASKMRFLAAQWLGILSNDRWLYYAQHANSIAVRLARGLAPIPGLKLLFPTEANAVFAKIPAPAVHALHKIGWRFYTDVGPGGGSRLMCSWDTTAQDVDRFIEDVKASISEHPTDERA